MPHGHTRHGACGLPGSVPARRRYADRYLSRRAFCTCHWPLRAAGTGRRGVRVLRSVRPWMGRRPPHHAAAGSQRAAWGIPRDQASPPPSPPRGTFAVETAPTTACPPSCTTTRSTRTTCFGPLPLRRSIASVISTTARARFVPSLRRRDAISPGCSGITARRKHSMAAVCSATACAASIPSTSSRGSKPASAAMAAQIRLTRTSSVVPAGSQRVCRTEFARVLLNAASREPPRRRNGPPDSSPADGSAERAATGFGAEGLLPSFNRGSFGVVLATAREPSPATEGGQALRQAAPRRAGPGCRAARGRRRDARHSARRALRPRPPHGPSCRTRNCLPKSHRHLIHLAHLNAAPRRMLV